MPQHCRIVFATALAFIFVSSTSAWNLTSRSAIRRGVHGLRSEKDQRTELSQGKDTRSGGLPNPLKAIGKLFKRKDKKPKSELEQLVDTQFKNSGPLGMLMGGAVKGLAKVVAKGFEESQQDVAKVADMTERLLRMDGEVGVVLGGDVRVGAPFSQGTSSSSINGITTKNLQVAMPVQGTNIQGIVSVQASQAGAGELALGAVFVEAGGRRIEVGPSGRSSSNGDSSSSANEDRKIVGRGVDEGNYVDVEIL
eukprot:CAMPEP_0171948218 /NCGR_PEP_ID=MMETSP0993-20121228/65103_1 /TAXON_ID=483369 /ORGANISM="non described non described, Strain CCMP2098" /LENGTH=251 /DNA_ID=CAMNT_0012592233 /DNA_START=49 /DNA_END=804 /DNA_ORIENTATION=-